jgi:hypothetical protein
MKERKSIRERAKIYNGLHCIEVACQTILHRSLFIER